MAEESAQSLLLPCLFCPALDFSVRSEFLAHLLEAHHFVIADVDLIVSLPQYVAYWKERLAQGPLESFATVIHTRPSSATSSSGSSGPAIPTQAVGSVSSASIPTSAVFYMLGDNLDEDKAIRKQLQDRRLASVLEQHSKEREDTSFSHPCLFCRFCETGNRSLLLDHMHQSHGFSIGLPDNLVFIRDYLTVLQNKLDRLQCLYCEKVFKSRDVLKSHMRKKKHIRVHPQNKEYDRFYMINYLEPGKGWEAILNEDRPVPIKRPAPHPAPLAHATSGKPRKHSAARQAAEANKRAAASSTSSSNPSSPSGSFGATPATHLERPHRKPDEDNTGNSDDDDDDDNDNDDEDGNDDEFALSNRFNHASHHAPRESDSDNDAAEDDDNVESQWDDWQEDAVEPIKCLFCSTMHLGTDAVTAHMKTEHDFDFDSIRALWHLNFYQTIKLVNYIRHNVMHKWCPRCEEPFPSEDALLAHMTQLKHSNVDRQSSFWNQAEYFFPTIENDPFLYSFQEDEEAVESAMSPAEQEERLARQLASASVSGDSTKPADGN
ncbi:hypothetical protein CAOG_02165 [Capsaspora owczarzaki ATCC 30864]|uniref:C2H2-type domain-containing protein n=1 Tax=Capsaspora owczarzaki (strain ATCC 30864) TaxID=595528 RepID=A0A0D2WKR7_CAPO3|nr:hypothetical protein CAOG_02165 [Capsaspora owczarzaki ATCC 30864]KJE90940.1 hypothetical protein CAOG_002165 [Capsaspora owczarzaki ATCC 30864]|eukprot:XP_004348915.2 hypothetical protein CAOG_02165 [Capsaspora owczarzaki ATCC 30864]